MIGLQPAAADFRISMQRINSLEEGKEKLVAENRQFVVKTRGRFGSGVLEQRDVEPVALLALQFIQNRSPTVTQSELQALAKLRRILIASKVKSANVDKVLQAIKGVSAKNSPLLALPREIVQIIAMQDPTNSVFYLLRRLSSGLYSKLPFGSLQKSFMLREAIRGNKRCLSIFSQLLCYCLKSRKHDDAQDLYSTFVRKASPEARNCLYRYLKHTEWFNQVLALLPGEALQIQQLRFTSQDDQQNAYLLALPPQYREATSLKFRWELPKECHARKGDREYFRKLQLESCTQLRSLSLYWRTFDEKATDPVLQNVVRFLDQQPLTSLTSLEKLSLRVDGTEGTMPKPEQFKSLPLLNKLSLQGFAPEATLIQTIIGLPQLTTLKLQTYIRDAALLRGLFQKTSLVELDLQVSTTEMEDVVCQEIPRLTNLRRFSIFAKSTTAGRLFTSILGSVSPLTHYRQGSSTFKLVNEAEVIASLRRQTELHTLCLNCSAPTAFFETLLRLSSLRRLELIPFGSHHFGEALQNVASRCQVEYLKLHVQFTNSIFSGLSKLPNLTKLILSPTISDYEAKQLIELKKLEWLQVFCSDAFTDKGLAVLGRLSSLKSLILSHGANVTPSAAKAFLDAHPDLEYFYCPCEEFFPKPPSGLFENLWALASGKQRKPERTEVTESDRNLLLHRPHASFF